MEVDDESNELNGVFEQLSQSTHSSQRSSQRPVSAVPLIPQSNVGNRRHRREKAEKEGQKITTEPGFGAPLNIQKQKRVILDGLRHILAHKNKAIPSKKDAFSSTPLDKIDEVADYLELSETGELLRYSSMVYALRVDTTYNDAMSTNVQLQPSRAKTDEAGSKKSKAEQKVQQATATQSLNLQKLQFEMEQDAPEEEQNEKATTPSDDQQQPRPENGVAAAGELDEEGGEKAKEEDEDRLGGMGSDDEEGEARREAELTEEQRAKVRDSKPLDTNNLVYTNTAIRDIIAEEYKRRQRNLDRKCDLNPMLMDDERKFRMAPAALLTNEYYQIATARYKDLNASGMLSYNSKVTHNGRMTLMHKRMDTWRDADAQDHTPPTPAFRAALSGLVDNAMRDADSMQVLPNYLFDPMDVTAQTSKLTTGLELADIEKKTREKILQQNEFDFLDKDDQVIEDGQDRDTSASPPAPAERKAGGGGERNQESSQSGRSRGHSSNPSTPTAETEASEASSRMTPKAAKEVDANDMGMSQAELDEYMEVMSAAPRKRKFRKAAALTTVFCEDEIKNGPMLTVDGLPRRFQQILFEKCAMGSRVEWERGANCEELQADPSTINEETLSVEKGSTDMDLMHLDKLWTSKYYKRNFSYAEVKEIKEKMKLVMSESDVKKKLLFFKQGEYEFLGEDDHWGNPEIAPDEYVPMEEDEEQPLVRPLEDAAELQRLERAIAAEDDDDDDDGGGGLIDDDDERIIVNAEDASGGAALDNHDPVDEFFMSDVDDENPLSSTTGASSDKRTDFTAGDDQRLGELADVNGMLDPTFVSDMQPSAAVRGMGKKDDSHWKGGNQEPVKPKKERKKKGEDEPVKRNWFDCDGDILSKTKLYRTKFPQTTRSTDLMKETDQLIMPEQVNIVPQEEYDSSLFFKSFFNPTELLPNYVERAGSGEDEQSGIVRLDPDARLEHYSNMLDSSLGWARQDGEDVFLSFLRTFRHFPDVATQQEMDVEDRVRSGEIDPEQAAKELSQKDQGNASFGGGLDDLDDFSGGGGEMDDDYDEGIGGVGASSMGDGALPTTTTSTVPSESSAFVKDSRAVSQARSLAAASTHGYGMRVADSEDGDDEADAYAKMGDREYHLRLIKLDTVAMKTALSDVLTNPLMVAEKLDETLGHFNRVFPTQQLEGMVKEKRTKPNLQTINEDEEMEVEHRSSFADSFLEDAVDSRDPQEIIDETLMELPDAMNVTRALFAPVKEKVKPEKTVNFGNAANSSQNKSQAQHEHIELKGHHTLKSTFTCLPARLPMKATSDVTVASTISMILHLANEHNLILEQNVQKAGGVAEEGKGTFGDWMNDFEIVDLPTGLGNKLVQCLDDADGSKIAKMSKRISSATEVLQQLSADEDVGDAEKRQKETEKVLAEMAAQQRREAEEERRQAREELEAMRKANGFVARSSNGQGASTDDVVELSDDSDVVELGEQSMFFKAPAPKRTTPRKANGNDQSGESPSAKRARMRPSAAGQVDETIIVLDD